MATVLNLAPRFSYNVGKAVVEDCFNRRRYSSYGKKLRTYFEIPAFSVPNVWRGASEIVHRFDFDIAYITFLNQFPREPIPDANFCPVIAWFSAPEVISRYKLWKNVGELVWIPDYAGQKVNAEEFFIEIWNTDTTIEVYLLSEDGEILLSEDGEPLLAEGQEVEFENIVLEEPIRFYSSRLVIPDHCCDSDAISLGEPEECVDPVFDLTDFMPVFGDYYLLVSPCERQLIKGNIIDPEYNLLQSTDGTWHEVYTTTVGDSIHLFVNQDNETPPPDALGYFPIIHSPTSDIYRVALQEVGGNHYFAIFEELEPDTEGAGNAFLLENLDDSLNYALYLDEIDDNLHLTVYQEDIVL